ncbi:ISAs1 family transposase [Sinorhizobium chiapasense]|uniref:ISAs1 family transposase n=1 Tax=Sinorhizobium chiapasense TaxID=501572 RepID=A0ABZ2BJC5_9HYPH
MSASAAEARLGLATVTPRAEENEVEAALKVVELLDLTDKIVTADALHCHIHMAQAVFDRRGDYMLALKGNRRHRRRQAEAALAQATPAMAERSERSHSRNEWRRAKVVATPNRAGARSSSLCPHHQPTRRG